MEFCSVMLRLWGIKPLMLLLLFLCISLFLSALIDIRYLIVALMIIFIVCPMIMGFLYYYYGLGERCYFNVTDHDIELLENAVKIQMYFPEFTDEEKDGGEESEKTYRCVDKYFDYDIFHRYYVRPNSIVFPLGSSRIDGFLWLPENAFGSSEIFAAAVRLIGERLSRNND